MKTLLQLITVLFAASAWAAPQKLTPSGGGVEILAIGKPSFIKIQGKGGAPKGLVDLKDGLISGEFEFDLQSLDTGISLRNEHMKDKYLEVGKHPKAKLEIKELKVEAGWTLASPALKSKPFGGQLTLHGVTKPASGEFSISSAGEILAIMKIKLSDYKVEIPSYMGITVADEVEVKVKIDKLQAKL